MDVFFICPISSKIINITLFIVKKINQNYCKIAAISKAKLGNLISIFNREEDLLYE